MAKTPITIAKPIANAMNIQYKTHLVINTSQFYGGEGKLVRMYVVKDSFYSQGQYSDRELFKTASGVYCCLFLRDLMYAFQGRTDVPEETNEGYLNVLAKKNGLGSIEWMKGVYLNESGNGSDEVLD